MARLTLTVAVVALTLATTLALPDLTLDANRLRNSLSIITRSFSASSCALNEGCVLGTGNRRLLQFDTVTPNVGTTDLYLGVPNFADPEFVYDSCHHHFHWVGYAVYHMYEGPQGPDGLPTGPQVTEGRKQAFCLLDSARNYAFNGPNVPASRQYHCSNQGISVGWMDIYGRGLDCQWIDVTGIADGQYTLRVELNAANAQGNRRIQETNYDNNVFYFPVTLSGGGATGGATGCTYGAWTSWTACSTTCGGGVQTRSRTTAGTSCNSGTESRACNTQSCNTGGNDDNGSSGSNTGGDGAVSQDGRCGANSLSGTDVCPSGQCCSQYGWCGTSAAHCAAHPDDDDDNSTSDNGNSGSDSGSSSSSSSNSSSGSDTGSDSGTGGNNGGAGEMCGSCWPGTSGFCKGENGVCYDYFPGTTMCPGGTTSCYIPVEDHDCVVSPWSAWSTCSADCGGGTQTRFRVADIPQMGNGAPCPEPYEETRDCNTNVCDGGSSSGSASGTGSTSGSSSGSGSDTGSGDVDCQVSEWGEYSTCDVTCGGGSQTRYRSVVVQPQGDGAACGVLEQSKTCNTQECDNGKADLCSNCFPGTSGPCQSYNSVCWAYTDGVEGVCPPGTSRCVTTGSVEADPHVEFEMTLAGVTTEEFLTNSDKFVRVLAASLEADPNSIMLTTVTKGVTVTTTEEGHRRLHGGEPVPEGTEGVDVKVSVIAPQRYGNTREATEYAGNMQKLIGDGALQRALIADGSLEVSATQMNSANVVVYSSQNVADRATTAASSSAVAGEGFALSAVAVALIAVGAAVVGAAVATGVVAARSRSARNANRVTRIRSSNEVVPSGGRAFSSRK